jgi:hypothetical protein
MSCRSRVVVLEDQDGASEAMDNTFRARLSSGPDDLELTLNCFTPNDLVRHTGLCVDGTERRPLTLAQGERSSQ